jgi:hypothetical protein
MSRGAFGLAALLAVVAAPTIAVAEAPTKQECAAANEAAQDLRRAGKLRGARARLAMCTAASCPGPIREDCAQRLKEVEAALPSVIFEAKNAAGHDLSDVHVTVDGAALLDKLDGTPVVLDPGEHHLSFEAEGLATTEDTVVLREGERNRRVRITFPPLASSATKEAAAVAPAPEQSHLQRDLGISLGAAGIAGVIVGAVFGVVAKSTYDNALQSECGGDPNHCSSQGAQDGRTAHSQATVSTAAFIGGGALLAGGATLYFTAPKSGDLSVAPTVGTGGAGLAFRGRW